MKAIAFIKKYATAGIALAAIIGFSSFKLYQKEMLTEVVFRYEAPSGDPDPYSKANVENTDNWKAGSTECTPPISKEAPCSIRVPLDNTLMGDGNEIDPSLVTINTQKHSSSNNYFVVQANNSEYSNEINRSLP